MHTIDVFNREMFPSQMLPSLPFQVGGMSFDHHALFEGTRTGNCNEGHMHTLVLASRSRSSVP